MYSYVVSHTTKLNNLLGFILCIVMSYPTQLTIHNIHYAPFIYRRPTIRNPAQFLLCVYTVKTNY